MIDTIKVRISVNEETANFMQRWCTLKQNIDLSTGEMIYQITSGQLQGTYDSRISFRVTRFDTVTWHLVIECSIHKVMLGHNCFGGSDDIKGSLEYLKKIVLDLTGVELPPSWLWQVLRIDIAYVYQLDSFEACQDWFRGLNACDYPRRKVDRYRVNGIAAYGSTTAVKFYHKGPEFIDHDLKRLNDIDYDMRKEGKQLDFSPREVLHTANRLIRAEVEVKGRKLKKMYGDFPTVEMVDINDLLAVYDLEVSRFLKEGVKDMETVRNAVDVSKRLENVYGKRLGGILLGTWYKLTTLGEEAVRNGSMKPSYYRHVNQLKNAGVSWLGTDVVLKNESLVPQGFAPVRSDARLYNCEAPEVTRKLQKIA